MLLPKRANLVQKAIEPRGLSAKTAQTVANYRKLGLYRRQFKYDGCHMIVIVPADPTVPALGFSRQGEPVRSCDHLVEALSRTCGGLVFFMEVWKPDTQHNVINGKFRSHSAAPDLEARVFDCVLFDDFMVGRSQQTYAVRYSNVMNCCDFIRDTQVRPAQFADDPDVIQEPGAYDGFVDWNMVGLWTAGLGKDGMCLKAKDHISMDLRVVGLHEGKGKFTGAVGALQCEYHDGSITVGGGCLTALERLHFWHNQDDLIGKIVEVRALTDSAHGNLREATFQRIRTDKTTPSYN